MKNKVLHIGIHSGNNIGDVAISEVVGFKLRSYFGEVRRLDFNFKRIVNPSSSAGPGISARSRNSRFKFLRFGFLKNLKQLFLVSALGFVVFPVFFRKVRSCDTVVIGGGNLVMGLDYVFPFQLFIYSFFSKILNKKLILLFVGVGPFNKPLSRYICKLSFLLSDFVVVRDVTSEKIALSMGVDSSNLRVVGDPVLSWWDIFEQPTEGGTDSRRFDILFSVMPVFDPTLFSEANKNMQLKFDECFMDLLIKANNKYRIGLIVTDKRVDLEKASRIQTNFFRRTGKTLELLVPECTEDLALMSKSCRLMLATRMHSAIFAISAGVPALCFVWQSKISGLMELLGLEDWLFWSQKDGSFSVGRVLDLISRIVLDEKIANQAIQRALLERACSESRVLAEAFDA